MTFPKKELGARLAIDEKRKRLSELNRLFSKPEFWRNQAEAREKSREFARLEALVKAFDQAETAEDISSLIKAEEEASPYDNLPAILSIYAGAGGTDAQDWAEMLLRMYLRFGERQNLKIELIDRSEGGEAGIKSVSLRILTPGSFGLLKSEAGVHRLVRLSPFNSDHLRQTSFALVDVIPEIEDVDDVEIKEEELRLDVFRSSGAGGQNVNKTESAVRLTHLPTGTAVSVQTERSQRQNKDLAMKILRTKLHLLKEREREEETQKIRGEKQSAEWGNQIRSYTLHPTPRLKDHRTNYETSKVIEVLDGDLTPVIEAIRNSNVQTGKKER